MKKFILIPVLIILYIIIINKVAYTDFSASPKIDRRIIKIAKTFDIDRFVGYVEERRIMSFNKTVLYDYVKEFNIDISEADIDYIYEFIISSSDLKSIGAERVSVQESATIKVERPYLFGLIRLPTYTHYVGHIAWIHSLFFYFVLALTILFGFLEYKSIKKKKVNKK